VISKAAPPKAGLYLPRAKRDLQDLGDIPPYLFRESRIRLPNPESIQDSFIVDVR
jgi:hypothetical protein